MTIRDRVTCLASSMSTVQSFGKAFTCSWVETTAPPSGKSGERSAGSKCCVPRTHLFGDEWTSCGATWDV